MKKLILRWLGIHDEKLRNMVGQAVVDALEGKMDVYFKYVIPDDLTNTLERGLENAASKICGRVAHNAVHSRIDGEDFIDQIIERIKRKQLNP